MIKNYYAGGNTSVGFYSLFDEVTKGLDCLYILKGGPGTGKSSFMRSIADSMISHGYDVEYIHSSIDSSSLVGIIFPQIKLGFIDGTNPHIIDPKYPGAIDEIINLGEFCDNKKLRMNRSHIVRLTDNIAEQYSLVYEQYSEAKVVHDEWEEIYLAKFDFDKADEVTEKLSTEIFSRDFKRESKPTSKRVFFGAATPDGFIHYIDNITQNIEKRYIIKGRPGTGKSTLMKKLAKLAEDKSLSVVYYPCGFDPNSLDMIIIPTLDIAIMDGTAPHVVNPTRDTDDVVDMFKLCVDENVEKENEQIINTIETRYKIKMRIGNNYLLEAKHYQDMLENYYTAAMDFDALITKRNQILAEIISYAKMKTI